MTEAGGEEPRKDTRALVEILHPEGQEGGWRDLPWLLRSSLRLVWEAGRRDFLVTAALQLFVALGATAQLFVNKAVLAAVLRAGGGGHYGGLVAPLVALVALTVAIEVAQTVEGERSRVLSELVARRALGRVIDVATRVDLLEFESPDFYDRLQRAAAQGQFRSLQMVNGLVGLAGAAVAAVGLVSALTSIQPLLLPLLLAGYVPLWIVAARNSGDFYAVMFGMTPNDRVRHYLQQVMTGRDPAKEVRAFRLAPF